MLKIQFPKRCSNYFLEVGGSINWSKMKKPNKGAILAFKLISRSPQHEFEYLNVSKLPKMAFIGSTLIIDGEHHHLVPWCVFE